jgi:alanine-alpha-ketoisovalerate/valine-pyruvate aminotransferase
VEARLQGPAAVTAVGLAPGLMRCQRLSNAVFPGLTQGIAVGVPPIIRAIPTVEIGAQPAANWSSFSP